MIPRVLRTSLVRYIVHFRATRGTFAVYRQSCPLPITAAAVFGPHPASFYSKPSESRVIPLNNPTRAASVDSQETTGPAEHAAPLDTPNNHCHDDHDFDIPLAVALAGAAFEAYGGVSAAGLVQKCPSGCQIVYTDQEFLRTKLAGLLKVSVEEVQLDEEESAKEEESTGNKGGGLSVPDISGHLPWSSAKDSSPEVKLMVGDSSLELHASSGEESSVSTCIDDNSTDDGTTYSRTAVIISQGYLFVRDLSRERLSVRVDHSGEGNAGAFIPVSELAKNQDEDKRGEEKKVELNLRDEGLESVGRVRLKARFVPFSEVLVGSEVDGPDMANELLGSPGPALMTEDWNRLCSTVLEASMATFKPIAYIENPDTDTQLWFFLNRTQRQIVIAFRGTEQDSYKDLLTDLQFTPINLESRHLTDSPRHANWAKLSAEPGSITKVMDTVVQAKKDIELRKKVAQKAAEAASVAVAEATRESLASLASASSSSEEDLSLASQDSTTTSTAAESSTSGISNRITYLQEGIMYHTGESKKEAEHIVSTAVHAVKNTASDVQEFLTRLKALIDEEGGGASVPAGEVWVHSGFLNAYDSVRGSVLGLIDTALAGEKDPWTILLTGHSLGGALATLCAFDLSHRRWSQGRHHQIVMYNYGSPRVGNKAFAVEFDRAVPNAWRIVNRRDAVVTVPRLVGYCHVGHAVIMGGDKGMEVQKYSSEAPYEGMAVPELLPAVGAAITSAMSSALPAVIKGVGLEIALVAESEESGAVTAEQLPELWAQEKAAWAALFEGTAIAEHMEEHYFKGIEEAVEQWRASVGRAEAQESNFQSEKIRPAPLQPAENEQ